MTCALSRVIIEIAWLSKKARGNALNNLQAKRQEDRRELEGIRLEGMHPF